MNLRKWLPLVLCALLPAGALAAPDDLEDLRESGAKGEWRMTKYDRKRDIKIFVQDGKGKGDAVRKGFAEATGEVLMILDADLTVPPEALTSYV